jgi:hypothetical protein
MLTVAEITSVPMPEALLTQQKYNLENKYLEVKMSTANNIFEMNKDMLVARQRQQEFPVPV